MRQLTLACLLACLALVTHATEKFPGIKEIMSAADFEAAGLGKLSAEELAALDRWLIRYTANDAETIRREVEEVKVESDKDIRSRIEGAFSGWDGKTVFRLQNGQVWQQRLQGRWRTKLVDPEVIISRNIFGFYELEIVEKGRSIGVKRLR
ncbi:hypothetical protein FKG94_05375 [Exilibacterium tricleocarpae]|uniref:Uncharacterized protein n=1 Tax=Exilibacterium tricleocarpae TaxID=2591008 RepID=A0A545U3N7_9GAMM|nr:hypothetical protein [Exilibacterium tricleocarpae]TQV84097.1 hypothetical protein FKG94_05375 [Exilibacterium tricleocarpae]